MSDLSPVQPDFSMHDTWPGQLDVALDDVLHLEEIDRDLFRATYAEPRWPVLYGGQVLALALLAAGRTVSQERTPHSLHGYFLRPGSAARPTVFRVERDREGRTYAARRVVALQGGEVILNLSTSFSAPDSGPEVQLDRAPELEGPEGLESEVAAGLFGFETRIPPQPFDRSVYPVHYWARATAPVSGGALGHAAALTYLSDSSSGVAHVDPDRLGGLTSLDHALWFHRPVRMDEWVLVELVPHVVGGGRGWYTGNVYDAAGVLVASLAQQSLFRDQRS
jgi:acyl-CoA thioesterase-2